MGRHMAQFSAISTSCHPCCILEVYLAMCNVSIKLCKFICWSNQSDSLSLMLDCITIAKCESLIFYAHYHSILIALTWCCALFHLFLEVMLFGSLLVTEKARVNKWITLKTTIHASSLNSSFCYSVYFLLPSSNPLSASSFAHLHLWNLRFRGTMGKNLHWPQEKRTTNWKSWVLRQQEAQIWTWRWYPKRWLC